MAHEQFFYSPLVQGNSILIEGSEHQHLSRVMRKKTGDSIWISDGTGMSYQASIKLIEKDYTRVDILEKYPNFGEPNNKVSLAVGMIKASHWEILLEKAVELGVDEIIPLLTQHTQHKHFKRERNEKIILAAMKQSGRSRLPQLHDPQDFSNFINNDINYEKYICDNQDDYSTLNRGQAKVHYMVLVGPEGGFSKEEVLLATSKDYKPISLSNRRLRTETACISAINTLSI